MFSLSLITDMARFRTTARIVPAPGADPQEDVDMASQGEDRDTEVRFL